jgi:hypothetical protein
MDTLNLFERRLVETITWCLPKVDAQNTANCLRVLETEREEWYRFASQDATGEHFASVESLVAERAERLRTVGRNTEKLSVGLYEGKLLACEAFASLTCGGAEQESRGYINAYDIPPADTWVCYVQNQKAPADWFSSYLICWVPKEFISLVTDGMVCSMGWGLEVISKVD